MEEAGSAPGTQQLGATARGDRNTKGSRDTELDHLSGGILNVLAISLRSNVSPRSLASLVTVESNAEHLTRTLDALIEQGWVRQVRSRFTITPAGLCKALQAGVLGRSAPDVASRLQGDMDARMYRVLRSVEDRGTAGTALDEIAARAGLTPTSRVLKAILRELRRRWLVEEANGRYAITEVWRLYAKTDSPPATASRRKAVDDVERAPDGSVRNSFVGVAGVELPQASSISEILEEMTYLGEKHGSNGRMRPVPPDEGECDIFIMPNREYVDPESLEILDEDDVVRDGRYVGSFKWEEFDDYCEFDI